jgi:hypothetical protein
MSRFAILGIDKRHDTRLKIHITASQIEGLPCPASREQAQQHYVMQLEKSEGVLSILLLSFRWRRIFQIVEKL